MGDACSQVDDRLRVWWEEDKWYDGVVTECVTQLDVDCRPTLAFRVAYDDGDDRRHLLDDYPLEKLNGAAARSEPLRHTRVTPRAMCGKRTRTAEGDGRRAEGWAAGVPAAASRPARRA